MYKPKQPFKVPMMLLKPISKNINGVVKKTYEDSIMFFGSFRTFGGTEKVVNDLYTVIDTATVDTYYNPDIVANCRIKVLQTNNVYEIVNEPENIDMGNHFMQFKVTAVGGKA